MNTICDRCNRPRSEQVPNHSHKRAVRVVVEHGSYGCDTGCCGHTFTAYDEDGRSVDSEWAFSHPYDEDATTWAADMAGEWFKGVPIDMGESSISDD